MVINNVEREQLNERNSCQFALEKGERAQENVERQDFDVTLRGEFDGGMFGVYDSRARNLILK